MNFLLITLLTFSGIIDTQWLTDLKEGENKAAEQHKLIVLNFSGSDWCGPCIRLRKEIFGSEAFEKYATDRLVLVNADFPRYKKNKLPQEQVKKNEALAEKYNAEGKFPFTVLLNADGKVLKKWDGLPNETAEKFVDEIKEFEDAGK